jgi:phage shock protein A
MIRIICSRDAAKQASNPPKGGVVKPPTNKRTYPASMDVKLKNALEALHSAREYKHSLQRELEILRQTKTKVERQTEEAILEARISTAASLEKDAELALKCAK